jgi:hypothetical protein
MFRFTVRDILWLTLVVGLAFGWWIDHRLLQRQHAREIDVIEQRAADMVHEATNIVDRTADE